MIEVVFDEGQYGGPQRDPSQPEWRFYQIVPEGDDELITKRRCDGGVLVAVTRRQFQIWKSWKIKVKR